MDPNTLQTADLSTAVYWRSPFAPIADVQELVEFIIMDIEPTGMQNGRWMLAEATVARATDLGVNDTTYFTRTHLGGIIHPGDSVMGYHLTGTNFNNSEFEAIQTNRKLADTIPDVVLIKKFYPRKRKNKPRNWRVKRMAKEESEMLPRKQDQDRMERDFEMFLRDVEEDQELRNTVALYKAEQRAKAEEMEGIQEQQETSEVDEDVDEDNGLRIPMDQLLDEFDEMNMRGDDEG